MERKFTIFEKENVSMSVESNLRDEVISELDELGRVKFGSEEYKAGVAGVAQLADKLIELSKLTSEDEKLEFEREKFNLEAEKFEEDKKDRKIKNRISVFGIAAPAAIAVIGGAAMFVYEERGTITSQVGRKIIDKYIFRVK